MTGKAAENEVVSSPSPAKKGGKGKAAGAEEKVAGGAMFKRVIATLRKHAAK